MMNAANVLLAGGHTVTLLNDHLGSLQSWFPHVRIEKKNFDLSLFDTILFQHDNTKETAEMIQKYRAKAVVFYPTYNPKRHPPLEKKDAVASPSLPLALSITEMTAKSFDCPKVVGNAIIPKEGLLQHKHRKRILFHPTSSTPLRTWDIEKFIEVAIWVRRRGFTPTFCLSKQERAALLDKIPRDIEVPLIESLDDTATLIFESHFVIGNESGLVHLASNLGIPFLVISGNKKRMQQWQPGWKMGQIVTPRRLALNIKGLRLRDKKWQSFITANQVVKALLKSPEIAL